MWQHYRKYTQKKPHTLTPHYIYHAFQDGHPESAAGLMQGRHGGPVLTERIKAFNTAQSPTVTPSAALQTSVTAWETEAERCWIGRTIKMSITSVCSQKSSRTNGIEVLAGFSPGPGLGRLQKAERFALFRGLVDFSVLSQKGLQCNSQTEVRNTCRRKTRYQCVHKNKHQKTDSSSSKLRLDEPHCKIYKICTPRHTFKSIWIHLAAYQT